MVLDEAIKQCEKVAEKNEQWLYDAIARGSNPIQAEVANCGQCAEEHRQIAEWLKELKETRRLLKLAVEDLNIIGSCKTCVKYGDICRGCRTDYKWVHADEAFALIGEECE